MRYLEEKSTLNWNLRRLDTKIRCDFEKFFIQEIKNREYLRIGLLFSEGCRNSKYLDNIFICE